ncbi:MAG: class I SAM-dependent methyltransferase [Candidatus Helarchaeota archaeon]
MVDKPMPNSHFKLMSLMFKVRDFFNNPKKFLENNIPITKGSIVLDYGCGPGGFTISLAELVSDSGIVYAADIHPLALEMVEKKAKKRNLSNIITIKMDGYNTGIKDGTVNAIIFFDTYHHIEDKKALFDEFYRILDDGGKIFMDPGHVSKESTLDFLNSLENFLVDSESSKKIILQKK